ncbi:carbohydrate ABC transporter permease [Schleiferilactobacillus harbinensis]|uniref:carbohydrate ABC transporter permease n=1 Tax=Schleiferilactobacillus harbinensis TaxID=304207 RepID=UPI0021A5C7FC|nr:carbohydrate ABC transporter permease [Schleiferilactobacillus harbinensis]MCT2909593.1 carbohydrate ABC transporter permease [Schleiferilactobacillus harbinensis]
MSKAEKHEALSKHRGLLWGGSILVLLISIIHLSPLYLLAVNSFKTREELYNNVLSLPTNYSFQYFSTAMEKMNFLTSFLNSLFITVVSVTLIVLTSSMTAWVIARNDKKWWGRVLYLTFIATMLIPFQTVMMPLVSFFGSVQDWTGVQVLNTRGGLIFMYIGFGAAMSVFLFAGFIKSIPYSLEEAAYLDGASKGRVFFQLIFPMLRPITNTVVILNVIWIWNDYLLPSLIIADQAKRTIPLSTFSFFGEFTIQWNLAMAGLLMTILPVIIFYAFAQRSIIHGVAQGSVK